MALIAKTGAQTLASRRPAAKATAPVRRSVKVCAKYGEQSKYFDLQVRDSVNREPGPTRKKCPV
eukprot:1159030-Pelagomonas_calceolata.AAC.4